MQLTLVELLLGKLVFLFGLASLNLFLFYGSPIIQTSSRTANKFDRTAEVNNVLCS